MTELMTHLEVSPLQCSSDEEDDWGEEGWETISLSL